MSSTKPHPLQPGDLAPDVSAPTQDGQSVSLQSYRGRPVVLYFYPKDNTPGCTIESCGFRDHYAALQKKGVVLLGISGDSVKSHARFAAKYSLPFPLLADTDLAIARAFGVWGEKKFMGLTFDGIHRMTFLIGPDGVIKKTWTTVKTKTHAAEVLAALDT